MRRRLQGNMTNLAYISLILTVVDIVKNDRFQLILTLNRFDRVTYPYSKALRLKKSSLFFWNVLKKILVPKKKSPPHGAFLELKKWAIPVISVHL